MGGKTPLRSGETGLLSQSRPLAVYCATDYTARRVIQAARLGGLKVPEDISVVGTGNIYRDSLFSGMPIASVELPYFEVGREAGRVLDQYRLGYRKVPEAIRFSPSRILERASARFDKVDDPVVARALDYMRVRFHEAPTVEKIARENWRISQDCLNRDFKISLSNTPYKELLSIKMNRVCQLLEHTDKRIVEIFSVVWVLKPAPVM